MLGREYSNHLSIITDSFSQMTKEYKKKSKKGSTFEEKIKSIYIEMFGIPEIGFQIRGLHFNKIVYTFISKKPFKKILDVGCGIGTYSFSLAQTFPKALITGGDIDKNKLIFCKTIKAEMNLENIDFSFLDITKSKNNKKYDFVVIIDVLEHVKNYRNVLKNISSLLVQGGYFYIHVPQPNQKRIFISLKNWQHDDHVHEGASKKEMEKALGNLGFKIIVSKETFGLFGKLAWEINHIMLSKNFVLAGITFPLLYILAMFDIFSKNSNGLGIAILAQKK